MKSFRSDATSGTFLSHFDAFFTNRFLKILRMGFNFFDDLIIRFKSLSLNHPFGVDTDVIVAAGQTCKMQWMPQHFALESIEFCASSHWHRTWYFYSSKCGIRLENQFYMPSYIYKILNAMPFDILGMSVICCNFTF